MKLDRLEDPHPSGHPLAAACRKSIPRELEAHYAPRIFTRIPKTHAPRADVVNVLRTQNTGLGNSNTESLCAALSRSEASVVITGQQPGLFGGPLFTLEKLAGTIALAKRIASNTGRPCVPIFWNQSEDHDLVEVNRMETPRSDGVHREVAPILDEGRCLDHVRITEDVVTFANSALQRSFGDIEWPTWLLPDVGEAFPSWTSRILLKVFEGTPFLLAEPGWFRELAAPLYGRAVLEVDTWHHALLDDTQALRQLGYTPQIETDEPSGLFVIDSDGARLRLSEGKPWRDARGREYTEGDLLKLIASNPRQISTSVHVRPLVQQWLFPVVAQIGGPAEVAYFAQFPSLFAAAGLELPCILQRPSSLVIGAKEFKWMESLGLSAPQLLEDPATWAATETVDPVPPDVRRHLDAALASLRVVATSDPLARAVDGFGKQLDHAYEKIAGTLARDRNRAKGVQGDRRQRLANWVRPKGRPQDRMLTLPELLARLSLDDIRAWLAALDPQDSRTVLALSSTA